jgi:sulfoxide reductase heme-binding subunit YedZ
MAPTRKPAKSLYLVLVGIVALAVSVGLVVLQPYGTPVNWAIRVAALSGYQAVFLAIVSSNYMRQMRRRFGRPFIQVHHALSIAGLSLVTLHPLLIAWDSLSLTVFVPRFDSWRVFLQLGGRPAWYLLGLASLAALLRRKIGRPWRLIHTLNYVAFWLASVHAILIGPSFQPTVTKAVAVLMSLAIVAIYVQKRLRARRTKT